MANGKWVKRIGGKKVVLLGTPPPQPNTWWDRNPKKEKAA